MGTAARQEFVTEADYLAAERDAEVRHEFVDGVPFTMTGASRAHNLLATSLSAALYTHIRGSGCRVASSGMKVRLAEGRRYYYPDLVVSCSDVRDEPDDYVETRPVLVVEILSHSTAATDRREKRVADQTLPSLIDCLIVSQDERNVMRYTRDGDAWTGATFGAGETLELASVDLALTVDDLYADVPLGED